MTVELREKNIQMYNNHILIDRLFSLNDKSAAELGNNIFK